MNYKLHCQNSSIFSFNLILPCQSQHAIVTKFICTKIMKISPWPPVATLTIWHVISNNKTLLSHYLVHIELVKPHDFHISLQTNPPKGHAPPINT